MVTAKSQLTFQVSIAKSQERAYFERTFSVPENVCRIDISYSYQRHVFSKNGSGISTRREINIIDLAVRDHSGNYIGASGAGRHCIHISATDSSPGYARSEPHSGQWAVIIGAYKVASEGVTVAYTVTFTYRQRILLKGDSHTHTQASDGQLTASQLAQMAESQGLDFLFLTDHNNYAHNDLPAEGGHICLFPGSEWTHYEGHAGMLGVRRPLRNPFCVNSRSEAWDKLAEARENGALVVINHPFCPNCGWHFGLESGGFDLIEVWNGGTAPSANQTCLAWWHRQLCEGKHYPMIGGSDFHNIHPSAQLGQPTIAVYAMSRSLSDVLTALRQGNSYIKSWPKGPDLWVECGDAILGETAPQGAPVSLHLTGLSGGECLRILTETCCEEVICSPDTCELSLVRVYPSATFVRFELYLHDTLLLLSNPIFFR